MGPHRDTHTLLHLFPLRHNGCRQRRSARTRLVICIHAQFTCRSMSFPYILDIGNIAAQQYYANAAAFLSHKLGFNSHNKLAAVPFHLPETYAKENTKPAAARRFASRHPQRNTLFCSKIKGIICKKRLSMLYYY